MVKYRHIYIIHKNIRWSFRRASGLVLPFKSCLLPNVNPNVRLAEEVRLQLAGRENVTTVLTNPAGVQNTFNLLAHETSSAKPHYTSAIYSYVGQQM